MRHSRPVEKRRRNAVPAWRSTGLSQHGWSTPVLSGQHLPWSFACTHAGRIEHASTSPSSYRSLSSCTSSTASKLAISASDLIFGVAPSNTSVTYLKGGELSRFSERV